MSRARRGVKRLLEWEGGLAEGEGRGWGLGDREDLWQLSPGEGLWEMTADSRDVRELS